MTREQQQRTKIKICGLKRPEDITYVNEAKPDYCGFIIEFPKSSRNVTGMQVRELTARLDPEIIPVGVFVNAAPERVEELLFDAEGANMPTTREATDYLMANGVTFMPGKAANAGGVATSALEMCQNSARLSWTAEEVDTKLHQIMVDIFHKVDDASKRYDMEGNYVAGANIAGFEKVVDAMIAQGIV